MSEKPRLMIPAAELRSRVQALAGEIAPTLSTSEQPLFVGVLKGCTLFMSDLVRALHEDVEIDFISISSYGDTREPSGVVKIVKDLETDIEGRDVVIVEDIVDTGLTLNFLRTTMLQRLPRSLRTVTLLDKSARRLVPVPLEFRGFDIPDVFVLGYGMDWQGKLRNLEDLFCVSDLSVLIEDPQAVSPALFGLSE